MAIVKRSDIKTGDLLIWSNMSGGRTSIWLSLVRFVTMSEYGHVSVAWERNGELFHVEATMPKIKVSPVRKEDGFFVIPMAKLSPIPIDMTFFSDKIGLAYGLLDAIRAYLGISLENDNKWQCAELTKEFYDYHELELGEVYTPTKLINSALERYETNLVRIKAEA